MSRGRRILTIASGRRAKWAVLVFWLIIVALAGPLSGKLTGAEKNDSSAWLPAKAESTKVLNLQSQFQSPNIFAGVVVYDRPSGLTSADRAKAVRRRQAVRRRDRRRARAGAGADLCQRRQGDRDDRAGQPGLERLERRLGRGDQPARHRAGERRRIGHTHRRPAGQRRGLGQLVQGHRQHPAGRHLGRRDRAAADHLSQPEPVAIAGDLGGRRAGQRRGAHLPAGGARRPDRQRTERRHPLRAGVRRGNRLCAAADRALPGGTAPARGPARGDGPRAAAGRAGHHRQRGHRDPQPADAVGRRAELHQEPGTGAGHRRRGGAGLHDDAAAGPAGDLRALGILAGQAHIRLGRAHYQGLLGRGWAGASRSGHGWSG